MLKIKWPDKITNIEFLNENGKLLCKIIVGKKRDEMRIKSQ